MSGVKPLNEKETKRYFDLHHTLIAFSDMFNNGANDREIAIVGGVFLDTLLEHIITNFLVDDEKEVKRLLQFDQPMGTYGGRTNVAYCLGLYGPMIRDDLRTVGKIRNRFAHDLHASFENDPIRSYCLALKWHKVSMSMEPPNGATAREIFQVGVNQLICYLHGVVGIARTNRCEIPEHL